jgi:signal transduction histidine kinase/integral membrane sensor domain MASE1
MGARAWQPWRGSARRAGLLVLEHLAIAGGYTLLGLLGQSLTPGGRLILIWPAAGFALAMLLWRGTSRWPAILLGSVLVSERWVLEAGEISSLQAHTAVLLTGAARSLAAWVGAQLIHRFVGTTRWPSNVRGVIGFIIIGGLIYPALAALSTQYLLLAGGINTVPQASLQQAWSWFAANSTGTLVFAPLVLAPATPLTARPGRARWEIALLGALYLVLSILSLGLGQWLGISGLMSYPTSPLMLWAALRFGARGAAFNNLMWAAAIISFAMVTPGGAETTQLLLQSHARIAVLTCVVLLLAAAVEERQQMKEALEKEREGLEQRVTERTREVARSLSLLHSSLESTADGLLVIDRQGRITALNHRFTQLWRIPASILECCDDARALDFAREQVADPEAFLSRVAYLYEHPELESEDEIQLKDGRIFERFSRPQRLGEEIIGRVWSFRDITLRRRAEAERDRLLVEERRAREAAEQAFREAQRALGLRDEFLMIAAHELKTPLTSMKMQLQGLERLLASTPPAPKLVSRLKSVVAATSRQLKRLQCLGDQLLDITRLSGGRLELRYERLDLREFVTNQLAYHAEAAARAHSELHLECDSAVFGEWDRARLEQILCNLLLNALKFGPGHPIRVRVEASAESVRLQVIDRGIGIAAEDQARIFERLERAVDSRHYGGLGLGLWIVRQSVAALGGHVSVQSELKQGSTFTVELPRTRRALRRTFQDMWERPVSHLGA